MASKLGVTALYVTPTQESGGSFDPPDPQDRRHCGVIQTSNLSPIGALRGELGIGLQAP